MIQLIIRIMPQAVKTALVVALTIVAPAREVLSATITVHAPDGDGRVFVDVVGPINDEDFKTFKEKTYQIYPIGAVKQVVVTLISNGGHAKPVAQHEPGDVLDPGAEHAANRQDQFVDGHRTVQIAIGSAP